MKNNNNELKITTTLTPENKKKFRKFIYLEEKTKKDAFNEALEIGLDILLKKCEDENKKDH